LTAGLVVHMERGGKGKKGEKEGGRDPFKGCPRLETNQVYPVHVKGGWLNFTRTDPEVSSSAAPPTHHPPVYTFILL